MKALLTRCQEKHENSTDPALPSNHL